MAEPNFTIDQEFRRALRPQTKQERVNLETLLMEEGCADGALTVGIIDGKNVLVDGHNTFELCQKHGIALSAPRYKKFKDRTEALEWIDFRQRARRNLTPEQMAQIRTERIGMIADAREEGKSIREIAVDMGVPKSTVAADLREAAVRGRKIEIPEPNEQETPLIPSAPKRYCDRCFRIHRKDLTKAPAGCPQCEALNRTAPPKVKQKVKKHRVKLEPSIVVTEKKSICPKCGGTGELVEVTKTFTRPTVAEIRAYCDERKNSVDPELFFDHYEANGWRVGRNPMKSWKNAVHTWEKSNFNGNGKPAPNVNAGRERAILMGWYRPSTGEAYDPEKHCEQK